MCVFIVTFHVFTYFLIKIKSTYVRVYEYLIFLISIQLFMKATLLDHIASECEKTEQSNQRHKEIIDSKEEVCAMCIYLRTYVLFLPCESLCASMCVCEVFLYMYIHKIRTCVYGHFAVSPPVIMFFPLWALQEIKYEQRGIKELEEQWKGFEKLREMEGRIADLKKELQWAYVSEIEKVRTYVRMFVHAFPYNILCVVGCI